jgi:drug/metabolite transporter (DMT)-like permease
MADISASSEERKANNVNSSHLDSDTAQPNQAMSPTAWFALMFAVFCWGLSFPLIKEALDLGILPITLAVLRYTIGLIPLILYIVIKRDLKPMMRALRNDWKLFLALGLVGITFPNLLQNYGMVWTSAHVSSIIQASGPVFTIILALIFLHERLGRYKIIGTALAIFGTLLLITDGGVKFEGTTFLGNLLVMLSAISYAFSSILSKKSLEKYEPLTVAILSILVGTPFLAMFWVIENPVQHVPGLTVDIWAIVIVLAILPGVVALILWFTVLKTREVSRVILFIYLIPVFATAIAYFIFGEVIKISTVFFAAIIICGVMIAQYEYKKKKEEASITVIQHP